MSADKLLKFLKEVECRVLQEVINDVTKQILKVEMMFITANTNEDKAVIKTLKGFKEMLEKRLGDLN